MGSGEDVLLTIHSDGTVLQSTRMKMSLLCLMNLKKFPFDSQHCPIVLESWGYNTSEINLEWEEDSPVTVNSNLELTEYNLDNTWTTKSINSYLFPRLEKPKTTYSKFYGAYSSLTVLFRFEREIGHYIMDYYVPSILLVVVSWVSFWLDPNAVPGRITLGTSTMLTFITLSRNIGSSLPKVSYIKATEIWFIVCTGFIFGSLVEFAFVNTIWRRRKNVELKKVNSKYILRSTLTPQTKRKVIPSMERNESFTSLEGSKNSNSSLGPKYNSQLTVMSLGSISRDPFPFTSSESDVNEGKDNSTPQKGFFTMTPQEIAQWIDRRSRLVFPCSFIVFNCLYWTFVYIEF
ncbi:pH-sensitive chloride channel 2 isoform X2 [Halyomorpha halys]